MSEWAIRFLWGLGGFIAGGTFGVIIMALMVAASRADEAAEKMEDDPQ